MEQYRDSKKSRRRCSVCRRPVKGHIGPCGPGNCFLERAEGSTSSDEEFYSHVKNGPHMQKSLRKLRQKSKVADFVREGWSESTSEDSEATQIQHSRSLPLGNPPAADTTDSTAARGGVRAKSEPPRRASPQRSTKTREPSGSRQHDVRDLRADKELVREVDKMLEGMLVSPPRVSRKTASQDKRDPSSGSEGSVHRGSDYTRSHGQRRHRHREHREQSARKSRSSTRKPRKTARELVDSGPDTSPLSRPSKSRHSARKPRRKMAYKHTSRDLVDTSPDTSPPLRPSKSRSSARKPRKKTVSERASRDFSSDTSSSSRQSNSGPQRAHFPGHGKGGGVTYDELSLPMFVHGYVKAVIESHHLSGKVDSKLAHLADLMFDAVYYDWPTVREFHASVLYGMEYATYTWDDTALFDAIRERHYRTQVGVSGGHTHRARAARDGQIPTRNPGRPRYCGSFQSGECPQRSGHWDSYWNSPVLHVCSACLLYRNEQAAHSRATCPYNDRAFRASRGNRNSYPSTTPAPSHSQAPAASGHRAIRLHQAVAERVSSTFRNHDSATKFPSHVDSFIAQELRLGALAGPFQYNPFPFPVYPIPLQTVEKRGIEFDTVAMVRRVPAFRLEEVGALVQSWLRKRKATKRELQSLIGKLVFVSHCVPPGRLFISRMLETLRALNRNHHRFRVSREFRLDLHWWNQFLQSFNAGTDLNHLREQAPWSPEENAAYPTTEATVHTCSSPEDISAVGYLRPIPGNDLDFSVPVELIRLQGDWRSDAYLLYLRYPWQHV
ncbi:hypothetical protein Bbelb_133630 [Branchiostoma belcheri]|nr:hypothetical protein Bbelb_133630 [Branchiostoma belcheri]